MHPQHLQNLVFLLYLPPPHLQIRGTAHTYRIEFTYIRAPILIMKIIDILGNY